MFSQKCASTLRPTDSRNGKIQSFQNLGAKRVISQSTQFCPPDHQSWWSGGLCCSHTIPHLYPLWVQTSTRPCNGPHKPWSAWTSAGPRFRQILSGRQTGCEWNLEALRYAWFVRLLLPCQRWSAVSVPGAGRFRRQSHRKLPCCGLQIVNTKIKIGELDCNSLLYLDAPDVANYMYNLIEYALLREEVRTDSRN